MLYIYIILYYYYIIYYTYITLYIILYYTLLLFSPLSFPSFQCLLFWSIFPLPSLLIYLLFSSILPSSQSIPPSFCSYLLFRSISFSSFPLPIITFTLYLSIVTYGYLCSINTFQDNLTPHVLSEWMVEVCGKYLCGVRFWCFVLVWWCRFELVWCLVLYIIYYILLYIYYYYILLYIIHILLLYYYTYTIIIYYTILFYSSSSLLPFHLSSHTLLIPLPPSLLLIYSFPSSSFILYLSVLTYTYLYYLTQQISDPACFIGVDGWGVW